MAPQVHSINKISSMSQKFCCWAFNPSLLPVVTELAL